MQTKDAKELLVQLLMLGIDVPISVEYRERLCLEHARVDKIPRMLRDKLRESETLLVVHEWKWPDLTGRLHGASYGLVVTLVRDDGADKTGVQALFPTETKEQDGEKEEGEEGASAD